MTVMNMSRFRTLKVFINQRLGSALDEIFGHVERTIREYEEELDRRHQTGLGRDPTPVPNRRDVQQLLVSPGLDRDPEPPHIKEEEEELWTSQEEERLDGPEESDVTEFTFSPVPVKTEEDEETHRSSRLHQTEDDAETEPPGADGPDRGGPEPAMIKMLGGTCTCSYFEDVQQLLVVKEEVSPEDQSPSLDRDPEPPHIKEEEEELWTGQEEERLDGPEESDVTEFTFSPVPVKTEEDEETHRSSRLHQTEDDAETEPPGADGPDRGGPEPARSSEPDPDDKYLDSSETEVSDDDWTRAREPQSNLSPVKNKESFICSQCGKTFGHKTNLKRHMRCHTGEKPFSCSFCYSSFKRREHLIAHMRRHSGEKPFSCSVCGASFGHGWSLDKHVRVHTGEKPFCCSLCGRSFRQRSDLVAHFRIHTGEKPFSCSVCGSSFTQRHTLVQHARTHTGTKPFVCSVCGKTFSRKGHVTRHMRAHTGEKPFGCGVCDKRFTWQSQFKRHACAGAAGTRMCESV